jgi:hypothetical protein
MTKTYLKSFITILAVGAVLTSCKKEESSTPIVEPTPTYTVPSSYNFTNVDILEQKQFLAMLTEISNEIKKGTSGPINAQKLKDMYNNIGNQFVDTTDNLQVNSSGEQISAKVYPGDATLFQTYFDSLASFSQSSAAASEGVAGVAVSGTSKYLLNSRGQEFNQLFQKSLMGAFIYYQIGEVYLSNAKVGDAINNTTVTTGKGTPMEHAWDEAFGFYGVPTDFPTNITGLKYVGSYSNQRESKRPFNRM